MTLPTATSLWSPQSLSGSGPEARAAAHISSTETRRLLQRYIARRVPACDVEDVVQATLCDAVASARAPSELGDLLRWLFAIARFKVADAHRSASRLWPEDPGDIPAPAPPIEARSLARWAERQVPPGTSARRTLQWMAREADGDKLESIAADEHVPAERVRQRVSRLRRWMRDRWLAELAALAMFGLVAVAAARSVAHRSEIILPELVREPAADAARLRGSWKLVSFAPAQPLSAARQALFDRVGSSFVVTFDGRYARAVAGDGSFDRDYGVPLADGGQIELLDSKEQRTPIGYAWEGDALVLTVPHGPWAGVARFRAE
jgi:DNA-directed RNA polymerase specialized sigma24 family protein